MLKETRALAADLVAKEEAWLQDMLDRLGMTAEEAAKVYYIERHPIESNLDGSKLTATTRLRLRRYDEDDT